MFFSICNLSSFGKLNIHKMFFEIPVKYSGTWGLSEGSAGNQKWNIVSVLYDFLDFQTFERSTNLWH